VKSAARQRARYNDDINFFNKVYDTEEEKTSATNVT
jgi:hypothetical protein